MSADTTQATEGQNWGPRGQGEVTPPDPDFYNSLNSEVQDKGFLVTST